MENSQDFWHEFSEQFTEKAKIGRGTNLVGFGLGYGNLKNAYATCWWRFLVSSRINEWDRRES